MRSTRTIKAISKTFSCLWDVSYWKSFKSTAHLFSPYWLACIPLTAIIVIVWHGATAAQDAEITGITIENINTNIATLQGTLNAIWVLIAAILVICMNAGFGMLETGFCRHKNAVNILSKNLIVLALAILAYWAIGFSLMFGSPNNPVIGGGGWFLSSDNPATYGLDPFPTGLPISVAFLFQAAFAMTAATIVSGAVAERIKFIYFLIFSLLLVAVSYPITGHWVWGGGWLGNFKDFAGSTVVHSVGGWAALVGAAVLGPRMGKYIQNRPQAIPGHNMSIATLGCLILWIGWFGFNAGSQLAADEIVPYIAVTTNLAAAAGGVAATLVAWFKNEKPDLPIIINGILSGLVGITAGCDGVSYFGAVVIGAIAGVIVVYSVDFFDSVVKIDDPVGAISVHLVNGIWGTLAVGFFNTKVGLFYGGGIGQLINQIVGIVSIGVFTVIFSGMVWIVLEVTLGIRVTQEEEINGLDIGEHGMEAYHGFVKESDSFAGKQGIAVSDVDVETGPRV
ncbi:ammonium/methylammonium permease [cyanobacterium endosymbiont of Rhopalodia gibberula]|uniref:ammonium transporter n=1 Tax=cyanobacterium endosymbiont of Rhopalodia gibberula TaxID=1763363 RepID=UPI000DC6D8A3|nr:ammonium transporter [cyanobacterium endosymbiont of Rhopalodia gibberula]BBA79251.1 ammonium/methylammonium permease [cyanobacterium endosymbiont of Rhopalodia gibberula]